MNLSAKFPMCRKWDVVLRQVTMKLLFVHGLKWTIIQYLQLLKKIMTANGSLLQRVVKDGAGTAISQAFWIGKIQEEVSENLMIGLGSLLSEMYSICLRMGLLIHIHPWEVEYLMRERYCQEWQVLAWDQWLLIVLIKTIWWHSSTQ